jgi:hypothetical protein
MQLFNPGDLSVQPGQSLFTIIDLSLSISAFLDKLWKGYVVEELGLR